MAFIAPEFLPTWGGAGIYSVELVKNLCKEKDMEIHVITPERGRNYSKEKILRYFDNKIHIHNISKANDSFFYNFSFQLAVLLNFQRLNKEHKFDLVHSASLVHMPDIYLKFRKLNIPTVTTVHSTLKSQSHIDGKIKLKSHGEKSSVERLTSLAYPYIGFLEKIYLKRSNNFITVSNWIKSFIPDSDNPKDIEVIHNGVDITKFAPRAGSADKTEFDYLDKVGKPIVLYCGRLLALKGLKTLIESMKQVLKEEDAYFVFAGTGDIKAWENLLKLNNVPKDNYRFLGYVAYENIHQLYQKADIFVLPSLTDSCPLTILEAMSTRLPIIASNVGGISELIDHNKEGILVEPGNPDQIAESIINLLRNPELRKQLATNARAKVEADFDSKLMAEKTRKYYEILMEGA